MKREVQQSDSFNPSDSSQLPRTVEDSIAQVKNFALQEFDREIAQKQLYYHTHEHIQNVQRRADLIFRAIYPDENSPAIVRMKLLLDLGVVAHDMVQVFASQTQNHVARQRKTGVSETATIEHLVQYIHHLNAQLHHQNPHSSAQFTEADIQTIRDTIAATICVYDSAEQAIYQPKLSDPELSIVARILALADVGALGIDGIEVYNHEGSLLFLEENLDVVPLLFDQSIYQLESVDPVLYENIRQRLLKRCRFQVTFAKSRLARFSQELIGFPEVAIPRLTDDVFKHLNKKTIQTLETITPTADHTSLERLLRFFQFEKWVSRS